MATQSLGSLVTYLRGDNKQLGTTLQASKMMLGRYAKFATKAGLLAAAGFMSYKSVSAFSEFEAGMRNVNTIARESEAQLQNTSDKVLEMSANFGRSTSQMTKALYDINSAGFYAARGINILREATKSAIAGIATVDMSARSITSVINAYGLKVSDAADISDTLFATVKKGVLTYAELTSHMGSALATAAAAKVPFDQLAAAAATMTKKGMVASRTFISLNMFLMQMIKPTKEIQSLFVKLGYSSSSAALAQLGLAKTLKLIRKETGGVAENIGKLGFNVRAIRTAFSLISDGGRMFANNLQDIATKEGRLGLRNEALLEQTKTLNFQVRRLKSSYNVLLISIGKVIKDSLGLTYVTKKQADQFGALSRYIRNYGNEWSVTFRTMYLDVKRFFSNMWDLFQIVFMEPMQRMTDNIVSNFQYNIFWIEDSWGKLWRNAGNIVIAAGKVIGISLYHSVKSWGRYIFGFIKDVGDNFSNLAGSIKDFLLMRGWDWSGISNKAMIEALSLSNKESEDVLAPLKEAMKKMNLSEFIAKDLTDGVNTAAQMGEEILKRFGKTEEEYAAATKSMWDGIMQGLKDPIRLEGERDNVKDLDKTFNKGNGIEDVGSRFADAIIKGSLEDYQANLGQRSTTEDKIEKNTKLMAKEAVTTNENLRNIYETSKKQNILAEAGI